MIKKLLLAVATLILLIPIGASAAIAAGWNAPNLTAGFISPTPFNGIPQGLIVNASSTITGNLTLATTTTGSLNGVITVSGWPYAQTQAGIQSAINICNTSSCAGVQLGKMDITIAASICVPNNVNVFGTGASSTIIRQADAMNASLFTNCDETNGNGNFSISNLALYGNRSTNTFGSGVEVKVGNNFYIHDVYTQDFYNQGIDITNSTNFTVEHTKNFYEGRNGIYAGYGDSYCSIINNDDEYNGTVSQEGSGLEIGDANGSGQVTNHCSIIGNDNSNNNVNGLQGTMTDTTFSNNVYNGNGNDGINISGGYNDETANDTFTGEITTNNSGHGVHIFNGGTNLTFNNLVDHDNGQAGIDTESLDTSVASNTPTNLVFNGGDYTHNGKDGALIQNTNYTSFNGGNYSNNNTGGAGLCGIRFLFSSTSTLSNVNANDTQTTPTQAYGVCDSNGDNYISIIGGTFNGNSNTSFSLTATTSSYLYQNPTGIFETNQFLSVGTSTTYASFVATNQSGSGSALTIQDSGYGNIQTFNSRPLILNNQGNNVGIGATTSPFALFTIEAPNNGSSNIMAIATSSGFSTSTTFKIDSSGNISVLSGATLTLSATTSASNGFNLSGGCFAISNTCLSLTTLGGLVNLTNQVTGILPVQNGGTGSSTLSQILVGNGTGPVSSYSGTSCTNQFIRSLNGSGVATCSSVSLANDVTGQINLTNQVANTLPVANGGTGSTTLSGIIVGNGTGIVNTLTLPSFLSLSGSTLSLGTLSIANGGTNQGSQTTNGINYYDGTHITSGSNLTYDGTNAVITNGTFKLSTGGGGSEMTLTGSATQGEIQTFNSKPLLLNRQGNYVGIGTTTPGTLLSLGTGSSFINLNNAATSTFAFGQNILGGCYAINGTCLTGGGSGTVTSVATDATLTGGPITTTGTLGINLSTLNTWNNFINVKGTTGGYEIDGNLILQASSTNSSLNVGQGAGTSLLSTSLNNVTLGFNALTNATSTNSDVCIGWLACQGSATVGSVLSNGNVGIGAQSLMSITTGGGTAAEANVGVGSSTLRVLTTGQGNIAVGTFAGAKLTTANNDSLFGYQAGAFMTSGSNNAIFGFNSGAAITTGASISSFGLQSLLGDTTGVNSAFGAQALSKVTTHSNNSAFGLNSLASTTGDNNIGIGTDAGLNLLNITSASSTFLGAFAGYGALAGYGATGTVAIGASSGFNFATTTASNLAPSWNTLIGTNSGFNITNGADNIILGSASTTANDNLTTGSDNIKIGDNISFPSATASGQLDIGNIIYGANISGTGSTIASGGIGIASSTPMLFAVGNVAGFASTVSATSTIWSSLVIATSSPNAFVVQDQYGTSVLNVGTASTTGPIFTVGATTSSATNLISLFSVDQYGGIFASSTGATPTISCTPSGGTIASQSNNEAGSFTTGTASTACTITYSQSKTSTPYNIFLTQSGTASIIGVTSQSATSFTVGVGTAVTGDTIGYSTQYY